MARQFKPFVYLNWRADSLDWRADSLVPVPQKKRPALRRDLSLLPLQSELAILIGHLTRIGFLLAALTARILLLLAGLLTATLLLLTGLLARVLILLTRVLILSAHSGISLV
jgi:hypothetical protein